jgi:hypothetical protein
VARSPPDPEYFRISHRCYFRVMSHGRSIVRTTSTVISGVRIEFGKTEGDVRVTSRGKLIAGGFIAGTLTVDTGGYAYILGMVGGLVIEPGARAKLPGMCTGDVTNHGGDLTIKGTVSGTLHGRSTTRVMAGAKIRGYGEPIDPRTGEVPLPEAAELASAVIDDLTNARWADVRALFDATMHDHLSEEELAAPWPQIAGPAGAYQGHGDTDCRAVYPQSRCGRRRGWIGRQVNQ